MLTGEQSNTSLIFGESAILKVLRRLFPGQNPDLEVNRALARRGSAHVAEPYGWIEASDDDDSILLAILSRYLPGASDGWSLAATSLRDLYSGDGVRAQGTIRPDQAGGDFAGEAFRLGAATAEVHADLAARVRRHRGAARSVRRPGRADDAQAGQRPGGGARAAPVRWQAPRLLRRPGRDSRADAGAADPRRLPSRPGAPHRDRLGGPGFRGRALVPLRQRRAPGIALRDVAGMLRSFDYAARHQLIDHPDTDKLRDIADEWAERSQAAFCKGYADAGGMDPQANAVLLRALMLDKAVYEVVYEARHRPSWLSIPLDSIAASLCQTSPPRPSPVQPSRPPGPPARSATLRSTGSWTGCTTTRTRSSARTRARPGRSCAPCAR